MVVPATTRELVIAVATEHRVVAQPAVERVVADAALEPVVAVATLELILSSVAEQLIDARIAAKRVVTVARSDLVVVRAADQRVIAGEAVDEVVAGETIERVGSGGPGQCVAAGARRDGIARVHASEDFRRCKVSAVGEADAHIVAGQPYRVARASDTQLVRREHEVGERDRGVEPNFILVRGLHDVVPESAREQEVVVALSGCDPVVAGAAFDLIVACATVDRVVARTTGKKIVAGIAGDAIVARVALVTGVADIVAKTQRLHILGKIGGRVDARTGTVPFDRVDAFARTLDDDVVRIGSIVIVAEPSRQAVHGRVLRAVERICKIVAPAVDRCGAGEPKNLDVVRKLVGDARSNLVGRRTLRAVGEYAVVDDPVPDIVDDEDVVAAIADHRVGAGSSVDVVDRRARCERVKLRAFDVVVERVADALLRHARSAPIVPSTLTTAST